MGRHNKETFNASAVIEFPKGSRKFVLIEETAPHKKGLFNLPGGTKDSGDPSLPYTAMREIKEETGGRGPDDPYGLDILIEHLIHEFTHDTRPSHRIAVFSGLVIAGEMRPSPEHPTVGTYGIEEIEDLQSRGMLRHPRVLHAINAYLGELVIPMSSLAPEQVRESSVIVL